MSDLRSLGSDASVGKAVKGLTMKFTPLIDKPAGRSNTETNESLTGLFKNGHAIGNVTISDSHLFVKKGVRRYYIAYGDAEKIFRRVRRLHANICCGDGDIEVEYLVVISEGRELAEITLPDKKAAQMLFAELKQTAPELDTTAPARQTEEEEEAS